MTETEWANCTEPDDLLAHLRGTASARKLHLFTAACHRLNWEHYPDVYRRLIAVEERYADDQATVAELFAVLRVIGIQGIEEQDDIDSHFNWAWGYAYDAAKDGAYWAVGDSDDEDEWQVAYEAIRASQCCLLREIVGNPFRRINVEASWRRSPVRELAEGIYVEGAFDRMPILADALEEAGCLDKDILAHCRGKGPHVRGCWVVDQVLGKE